MTTKNETNAARRFPRRRAVVMLGLLLTLVVAMVGLAFASDAAVSAKTKPDDQSKDKKPAKTLKIVSVSNPLSFTGVNPYPTSPQAGQKLVAVEIDYDRDFKNHLRSSEAGEVYLTDAAGQKTYYTVDTAVEKSDGPGKKPAHKVTFVFQVPQDATGLSFHYSSDYTLPLPAK